MEIASSTILLPENQVLFIYLGAERRTNKTLMYHLVHVHVETTKIVFSLCIIKPIRRDHNNTTFIDDNYFIDEYLYKYTSSLYIILI